MLFTLINSSPTIMHPSFEDYILPVDLSGFLLFHIIIAQYFLPNKYIKKLPHPFFQQSFVPPLLPTFVSENADLPGKTD